MFQQESWAHHSFVSHEYLVTARSHSSHVGLWLDCDEGGTSTHESTDAQTRRAIPPDFKKTRMYSSEGGRVVSWCGKGSFKKTRKKNKHTKRQSLVSVSVCVCPCLSVNNHVGTHCFHKKTLQPKHNTCKQIRTDNETNSMPNTKRHERANTRDTHDTHDTHTQLNTVSSHDLTFS